MLLIWEVTSGADAKSYFGGSVAAAPTSTRQQYYSEGQEAPGRFGGKLAERLGIAGQVVDKKTFDRLCDNLHPTRPGKLTPRTNDHRRVCYDFTFSGPKSFSVIEAFAGDEERQRLRQMFDEAIDETVREDIESDMQARERRRGADHDVATGNLLTVAFDHGTSRPLRGQAPDPHRHKHLLIWNATETPDGRIVAGQFFNLVRDKGYYEAAMYARLAHKLEEAGYAIDRRGGKEWEIAGVPQSVIEKFSKRTEQIDAEAERRGIKDASRKAKLGAETRSKKQKELTMPELRKAWDAQLDDSERAALQAVLRREAQPSAEVTPAQAVAFAIAHLSEDRSAWPERELKRVTLLHGLGHVTPEQVMAELPRQGVIVREIDGRRMATTVELQAEEMAMVGFAAAGRGTVVPVGVPEELTRVLDDGQRLNDGQWAIVQGLLNSSNRVNLVEGPAGAGKSWSLQKYDEAMRMAGQRVTYLAVSTDGVEVLEKDHFRANTVARFLLDGKLQEEARGGWVVVDETSLLGHKDAARLFEIAKQNDLKLTFVGDPAQHTSVARGATMRVLKEYAGVKEFRLTEIMRQKDTGYLAAAKLLSEGHAAEAFDLLTEKHWVREIFDDEKREAAIAAEYLQAVKDKKSVILVAPTHAEGGRVTEALRSLLREAGRLGKEEHEFTRLVPVNASEAERQLTTTYRPGDVIQFHNNAKGFKKGDRLTITDPAKAPVAEASKFSLYRPETMKLSAGDLVRATATVSTVGGKHKLRNGSVHTVAGFTDEGIVLKNGWVIPSDAGHLRMGWVDTSFSAQGRTVDRALLAMSSSSLGATNTEQMYVSSTRAKQALTIFTDDSEAIRAGIQRSSQKLAALDLKADRKADGRAKARKHLARKRKLSVINSMREAYLTPAQQVERQAGYER